MWRATEITPLLLNGPLYRAFKCWLERGWVFIADMTLMDCGETIDDLCSNISRMSDDWSIIAERDHEECFYKIKIIVEQYNLFGRTELIWKDRG